MRQIRLIMGMPIAINAEATQKTINDVYNEFKRIDKLYSPYKPESLVSRLQAGLLDISKSSAEMKHIAEACNQWRNKTDGYFDAYYKGVFDPSGYVKGWAISQADKIFQQHNVSRYLIDAGGDILASGSWSVGIRHPKYHDKITKILKITDAAVATSGLYERGDHIYDPHDQQAAKGVQSITVVGPEIITCDVLATALFAMPDYRAHLETVLPSGYDLYAIDNQDNASYTADMKHYFT